MGEPMTDITPEASAALAARDARMRREGMERALDRVSAVRATTGPIGNGDEYGRGAAWALESAEAAIRADMEGER